MAPQSPLWVGVTGTLQWGGSVLVVSRCCSDEQGSRGLWGGVQKELVGGRVWDIQGRAVGLSALHLFPGAPGTLWVGTLWPRSAQLHWAPPRVPPDGYNLTYGPLGGPMKVMPHSVP